MTKIKTYYIILSKTFLKGHSKHGEATNFGEKVRSGEKKHTIVGNYELWSERMREVREGLAVISVRQWSGVPYRSKQVEIKRITEKDYTNVDHVFITYSGHLGYEASVESRELFGANEREALAHNDGLDVLDFSEWFFQRGKVQEFSGAIIHFTDFRY